MRRREFITVLGATAAWPLAARAQQPAMPVIGILSSTEPYLPYRNEFLNGLAENGYSEGRNVLIEDQYAQGQYDRLPGLAAGLVRRRVDVIVTTGGSMSARAAKAATDTIPIVALIGGDPVRMGLASSLNRPGGNLTGVAQLVTETEPKRLELLRELVPDAIAIAYLVNPALASWPTQDMEAVAHKLGSKLMVLGASSDGDLAAAFASMSQEQVSGLVLGSDPFFFMRRAQLVALSTRHALPTIYFFREFAALGGLISYGTRLFDGVHQVGAYAAKILKGTKPADLPITQQSEKIELVINLKTAKSLGLTVPQSLLARADEVIE
ncbi:putative ABC transport system substrate-binding protein [Rhizobiales bacterium GAS191]|nr:putative ABC transport system substrate-binding protein [Rhizobiales bacterium GAS191]